MDSVCEQQFLDLATDYRLDLDLDFDCHSVLQNASMAASGSNSGKKAGDLLKTLPRVSLANLRPNPGARQRERQRGRGQHGGNRSERGHKGQTQRGTKPRLGFEGGQTPFYLVIPKYGFNEGHSYRRQYHPLSLRKLQYLIDLGRVDPSQPIDVTQLVNARGVTIQTLKRDYGVQLVGG